MMFWWIVISVVAVILIISILLLTNTASSLSAQQEQFIHGLHPSVRNRFRKFIADIEKQGWQVEIASCHRGWAKSLHLWNTLPEVKACCQPGRDYHYMGLACDLVLHGPNGQRLGLNSSRAAWEASPAPALAKKHGLRWGGLPGFSYWDPVHFDYPAYTMDSLVQRVEQTCGSLQGDCGNSISHAGLVPRQFQV
jgi:hypothetical protein